MLKNLTIVIGLIAGLSACIPYGYNGYDSGYGSNQPAYNQPAYNQPAYNGSSYNTPYSRTPFSYGAGYNGYRY
jgi:hypothetical protein